MLSGLIVSYTFTSFGLSTITLCVSKLGVDTKKGSKLNTDAISRLILGPTLATGATVAVCCAMMVILRAWMLWKQQRSMRDRKKKPAVPKIANWWYIILADGLLVPACSGLALTLVLLLGFCLVAMAVAYFTDKGAQSALDSGIGGSLDRAKLAWGAVTNLSEVWTFYTDQALSPPTTLSAQISPSMDILQSLVHSRMGTPCPEFCIDLSSLSFMLLPPLAYGYGLPYDYPRTGSNISADGGSCLCDLSRMRLVQKLASQAWREQLIWAALGLLMAYLGAIWLMMGLISNREKVASESRHGGSPASQPRRPQHRGKSSDRLGSKAEGPGVRLGVKRIRMSSKLSTSHIRPPQPLQWSPKTAGAIPVTANS